MPWHPVLFALAPVIALASANIEGLPGRYILRPALLTTASAAVFSTLLGFRLRNGHQAALLGSLTCVFFLYTPMHYLIMGGAGPASKLWAWRLLAALLAVLFVTIFVVLARSHRRFETLTPWVNGIGLAMLAVPPVTVTGFEVVDARRPPPQVPLPAATLVADSDRALPDIYYIVLDGYGRADMLDMYYGFDNSSFVGFLQARGFFVASASLSNYAQTTLSLASSLNMSYLDFLAEELGRCSQDQQPLDALVGSSVMQRELDKLGYTTYAFATEYRRSEVEAADVFLTPPLRSATPLEALLFQASAFSIFGYQPLLPGMAPIYPGYAAHREMVEFGLQELRTLPGEAGPKFVFARLVIPHPPFVVLADGRPAAPTQPYLLRDGNETGLTPSEYVAGYVEQLRYINVAMQDVLASLQDMSTNPPVIIIQGDHGPGSRLNWEDPSKSDTFERHAILNALYLAGESDPRLTHDLTPVNTFRIVFNHFFATEYPMLPNKSEFSTWRWPYDFSPAASGAGTELAPGPTSPPCGVGAR